MRATPASASDIALPQTFGHFTLLERLAVGGMGEVFLARQRGIRQVSRQVVVKRLRPELAQNGRFVQRFLEEARICVRMSHPNVVQTYEFGVEDESHYLALEHINGLDLSAIHRLLGRLHARWPVDVAIEVMMQAAAGLHYVHSLEDYDGRPLRLVHRDISPSNLMISVSGHAKVLDFGVASTMVDLEPGVVIGKPPYLSPEQCEETELDPRSDLFSLGIVFWELLCGRPLFQRDTNAQMIAAVISGEVAPPSTHRDGLPPGIDRIVLGLLKHERSRRCASAETLAAELDQFVRQHRMRSGPLLLTNFMRSLRLLPGGLRRFDDAPQSNPVAMTSRVGGKRPLVLLVDDEEDNLRLLERVLHRDYALVTCTDPREAIEIITNEAVHLLVTDQRMPHMTGLELIERAREIRPQMQRVIISAYSDARVLLDAINTGGIHHYLLKPWKPTQVKSVVAQALRLGPGGVLQAEERLVEALSAIRTAEAVTRKIGLEEEEEEEEET